MTAQGGTRGCPRTRLNRPDALIIDDSRDLTAALALWLRHRGVRVETVSSGDVGLSLIATLEPALVLVDLCLPGLSGWEVARRVRALPLAKQPRLIAITGLADPVLETRSRAAGFDHHLLKPLDVRALGELLPV